MIRASEGTETENEMIKIHNTKDTSIDLSGWTLSDGEGTYKIPPNTIIPTRGYWTVYGSTYNPSKESNGLGLTDKHDYIVLLDKDNKIIDKYSW